MQSVERILKSLYPTGLNPHEPPSRRACELMEELDIIEPPGLPISTCDKTPQEANDEEWVKSFEVLASMVTRIGKLRHYYHREDNSRDRSWGNKHKK